MSAQLCIPLPAWPVHVEARDGFDGVIRQLFRTEPPCEAPPDYKVAREDTRWVVRDATGRALHRDTDADQALVALYGHIYEALVARSKLLLLHAGVVAREGRALVLPASQESGKSTLTASCIARGWEALSDDVCAIDPVSLTVRPYPRHMLIRPPTLTLNPWIAQGLELIQPLDTYGEQVFVARAAVAQRPAPAQVVGVVMPGWGERTEATRLGPGETALGVMDNALNLRVLGFEGVRMASALARAVPGWRLRVADPAEAVDVLDSLR